jgi:hypothetical protein
LITNARFFDAKREICEGVVHRLAELRLREDATELLRCRLGAFVNDRLDALAEAVPSFE